MVLLQKGRICTRICRTNVQQKVALVATLVDPIFQNTSLFAVQVSVGILIPIPPSFTPKSVIFLGCISISKRMGRKQSEIAFSMEVKHLPGIVVVLCMNCHSYCSDLWRPAKVHCG